MENNSVNAEEEPELRISEAEPATEIKIDVPTTSTNELNEAPPPEEPDVGRKRQRTESFDLPENPTFAPGIAVGGYTSYTRRAKKAKRRPSKKLSKKPTVYRADPLPTPEQLAQKEAYYQRVIFNVNPFYSRLRITQKVYAKPTPLQFYFGTKPKEIVCLLKYKLKPVFTNKCIAFMKIQYHRGTIFDWHLKFADLNAEPRSTFKSTNFKFDVPGPSLFCMTANIIKAAQEIFYENQQLRWKFKRLAYRWIAHRSRQRQVGADTDLITMEPIPQDEQLRIVSTETRTEYVFSGANLYKSVKSNIECQVGAIAEVKAPKNPYTNVPFTYGQMLEVYHQLASWCARKRKPIPTTLCLYRDCGFRPHTLVKLHHNFVSYKAALAYFMDDDVRGEYFVENFENLLDTYYRSLKNYNKDLLESHRFLEWFKKDPQHFLLRQWKRIVADYWYYEQTSHLVREHWRSDYSIMQDIDILIKASENILRNIFKPAQ